MIVYLCAHCGKPFERPDGHVLYCSDECRRAVRADRARNSGKTQAWREANPERLAEQRRQWYEAHKAEIHQAGREFLTANQAETLPQARRHYQMWTGPELELVSRDDLTAKQVALMTGRTLYAVYQQRHNLKTDPRKIWLAGLDDPEDAMTGAGMTFGPVIT